MSLIDCSGNFSSKSGCIEICSEKNLYSRLPNVDEIFTLRERYADYKLFLKPQYIDHSSTLKPVEKDSGNKSTIVKLKNLDKNIRFIIDGYYDFEKKIWMDNKRIIRDDEWFQSKSYYLNYPVMNDRIAFKKGKMILLKSVSTYIESDSGRMRLLDGHFVRIPHDSCDMRQYRSDNRQDAPGFTQRAYINVGARLNAANAFILRPSNDVFP